MLALIKSLYLQQRFFYIMLCISLGFLISYWIPFLYPVMWVSLTFLMVFLIWDIIALYKQDGLIAERKLPPRWSNSDDNQVRIVLTNSYSFNLYIELIDELPVQFQKRDFSQKLKLNSRAIRSHEYWVRPVTRGLYSFGSLNIFASSSWGIVRRRYRFKSRQNVKVYPSFKQMKQYDFLSLDSRRNPAGSKNIRRLGHTLEFEQIKEYVPGDDIRTLNWKATAKRAELMVNQYQDQRSQALYSAIDRSRIMKMPFRGLSLLDYSINSSLAFSNIALKRKDKVGLLSFSNSIDNLVKASSNVTQLHHIQEGLYKVDTTYAEADFGRLYSYIKSKITQRSLIMLYTNFEHKDALHRQLPYLTGIARKHLLVVIIFENTKLVELAHAQAEHASEIFRQTIAQELVYEKHRMKLELQRHGIHCILTAPELLTTEVINKYLEFKATGKL